MRSALPQSNPRTAAAAKSNCIAQPASLRLSRLQSRLPICGARTSVTARAATATEVDVAIEELLRAAAASDSKYAETNRVKHSLVAQQIERLKELGAAMGVNRVDARLNQGCFNGVLSTDMREIEEDSTSCTMARLTFSKFGPADMMLRLNDASAKAATGLPDQLKGPWEKYGNGYIVHSHFSIVEQYDGLAGSPQKRRPDPVLGFSSAIAEFTLPGPNDPPNRLGITFKAFRIAPAQPEKHLGRWLQLLKPHNPLMSTSTGVCEVIFDKAPAGHLDYLVMTDNYQVSQGNLGSVVVVKRCSTAAGGAQKGAAGKW